MKKKILSVVLIISLAITLLSLVSCDLSLEFDGTVNGVKYRNAENYNVGNCKLNYNEYSSIEINWVLGEITIKQSENTYVEIYENVSEEAIDDYKMHYIIEDGVLKVQFWQSRYKAVAKAEEKALTIELPATVNSDITIETVSSNIVCDGKIKSDYTDLKTVSGKIELNELTCNSLKLASVSGNITVKSMNVNTVSVANVSGNVNLSFKSLRELSVGTVSGNVNLKLNGLGASAEFDTVSGVYKSSENSKVFGDGLAKIDVETISGNLEINE